MLEETVVTKAIPARGWHQIDGILLRAGPDTRQGYIRIEKVSGENPFLAYGVVNDGGAPGATQRRREPTCLPGSKNPPDEAALPQVRIGVILVFLSDDSFQCLSVSTRRQVEVQ